MEGVIPDLSNSDDAPINKINVVKDVLEGVIAQTDEYVSTLEEDPGEKKDASDGYRDGEGVREPELEVRADQELAATCGAGGRGHDDTNSEDDVALPDSEDRADHELAATCGAGGRGYDDTNQEDEDPGDLDATASDVELADLKGVETTRRGDRAVMSSSDSQLLRKRGRCGHGALGCERRGPRVRLGHHGLPVRQGAEGDGGRRGVCLPTRAHDDRR